MSSLFPANRLLREPDVKQRTGVCKSTRRKLEDEGLFPRRVSVGPRAVAWLESEIEQWITGRAANRADVQAAAAAKAKRTPALWIKAVEDASRQGTLVAPQ